MKAHFTMFAAYNQWANERLYAAVARLPDADYRADRGAFFGSLRGTLNHLMAADRIWLHRLTGSGPTYARLDTIVHDDLPSLAAARKDEDARLITYVEALTEEDIRGAFTFRPISNPVEITQPRAATLAHIFNHQTHHRGQAHTLVTIAAGPDAGPVLDMTYFQRETGIR